jgi:DNA-binding MarR family transcriptional regulator
MELGSTAMQQAPRGTPDAERLRSSVQTFVRRFGLLLQDQTPCGQPLPTSHAHALMLLLAAGRPVRQNELGAGLGIDKSNVARLCAQMEEKRHVKQEPDAEDRRARRVCLTAKGQRVGQEVKHASERRFEELLSRIPAAKQAAVFAGLAALNEALVES